MAQQQLPPNPAMFRDIQTWAAQFYEWTMAGTRVNEENDPLPVLLPHKIGGVIEERAAVDGVVMYDPTLGKPVISIAGVWRSFTLDP